MRRAIAAGWLALATLPSCSDEEPPRRVAHVAPKSDADEVQEQLKKNPDDAEAWFHLAEILDRANLPEREAEALRKAIALEPDLGWAHLKLGTTCNRLGKFEEAVEHFRAAEKRLKPQPMLYNNLGYAYGKLGKNAEEIAAFRKAVKLRPSYAAGHFNLGVALLKSGAREAAEREYDALQELDEAAAIALKKQIDATPVAARQGVRR